MLGIRSGNSAKIRKGLILMAEVEEEEDSEEVDVTGTMYNVHTSNTR